MAPQSLAWEALADFLEPSRSILILRVEADGRVSGCNPRAATLLGLDPAAPSDLRERAAAHQEGLVERLLAGDLADDPIGLDLVAADGHVFRARCLAVRTDDSLHLVCEPTGTEEPDLTRELLPMVDELATLTRENARRSREAETARAELARAKEELETSYWHLRKVREVISICMECGRVRADETRWSTLAHLLLDNGILASHGLCPPCAARVEASLGSPDETSAGSDAGSDG